MPHIRLARPDDRPLLQAALAEAVAWREGVTVPVADVIAPPAIARYLAGWPGPRDAGLVAEGLVAEGQVAEGMGACWWRVGTQQAGGYGWIAEDVGELALGVLPAFRRRGVGTALLGALVDLATARGLPALSLSVEVDNPAIRIYRAAGFTPVGPAEAGAVTMSRPITPSPL